MSCDRELTQLIVCVCDVHFFHQSNSHLICQRHYNSLRQVKTGLKSDDYRIFGQNNRTGTIITCSLLEEQHKKTDDCRITQDSAHNVTCMTLFSIFFQNSI